MSAEIAEWFHGRGRVLFVHAHPDDETISTGGALAGLAAAGRDPLLVTLTRGEQGEVVPGEPVRGELAAHRAGELAAALAVLGVRDHAFLGTPPARAAGLQPRGYQDSGMRWGAGGRAMAARDAPGDALTRAPAVEALNDLLALADAWGAGAIVSYDGDGGYGHPDHVFAHRAARAVAHGLDLPFWEVLAPGAASAAARGAEPDDGIERYDVSPWLDRKVDALRAHRTQLSVDGDEIVHVGGQRQAIDRLEAFRRLG